MSVVTRFAPSPSGHLHLGHAFSAWTAWQAAIEADGRFLLRVEDIDTTRCKPEFEQVIFDDLIWLGLDWELPVRRQSEHFDDYTRVIERLRDLGVVYRCFKTRREVLDEIARAPHAPGEGHDQQVYRGPSTPLSPDEEAERVGKGEGYAWRLSMQRCADLLEHQFHELTFQEARKGSVIAQPGRHGDVILARKDVGTSYHLAVVHDDALQGITDVVRGEDLYEMTDLHVLLQRLLDLPTPRYQHHRLLLDEDGKRFAKRDKAATLKSMREAGASAEDIRHLFAD